jgi:hypothetical protein
MICWLASFLTDSQTCAWALGMMVGVVMVSLILNNLLAAWHVAILWDYSSVRMSLIKYSPLSMLFDQRMTWTLFAAFGAAHTASAAALLLLLARTLREQPTWRISVHLLTHSCSIHVLVPPSAHVCCDRNQRSRSRRCCTAARIRSGHVARHLLELCGPTTRRHYSAACCSSA